MKLFLVASDLHLSSRIWKHQPIEGDSYWSWACIVKLAIQRKVEAVVLAGDLLDKQSNGSEPVAKFVAGLNALTRRGISVYFTQGQHEYQEVPWASLSSGCIHVHKQSFDLCGMKAYGLDYLPAAALQDELKQIPADTQIMVMHQVWSDFMGDIAKPQGSFADLPDHVRLLLTGDFHETHLHPASKQLTVISPGSSHLRSVSEPEEKYVTIVTVDPARTESPFVYDQVPLPTRRIMHYEVTDGQTMAQVAADLQQKLAAAEKYAVSHKLPPELVKPLLRVTHSVSDADWPRQITETFAERAHLFFKLRHSFAEPAVLQPDLVEMAEGRKIHMRDCLPACIQPEDDPEAYELAELLINTDGKSNVTEVLTTWLNQQMQSKA